MLTKWLLDIKLSPHFEKYKKIDFGIGIDWSDVYVMRAGIPRDTNNNDLIFIGKCVNYATAIANQAENPNNIEISEDVCENLEDYVLYARPEEKAVNMWEDGIVDWKGERHKSKLTKWYYEIK